MNFPTPATVFVVDDDADVRAAMQRLLKTVGLRAEAFGSAKDFLERNLPQGPSCLILDIRLPGMSGLDVQQKLVEAGTRIPVIFITAHADVPLAVKAMKSGAVEFLAKPFRGQDLLDAVQQALARDEATNEERSDVAVLQERYSALTAREREVMGLIVSGMHTKEVGSTLRLSEITVAVHRGRVMRKMHAGSPAELGRMAEKLKLPQAKSF
ncbi:MAG TPA: response regulator [Bryobacteraceae bacterium]